MTGNRSTSFETIQLLFLLINNTEQNIKLGKVVAFAIGHFTVTGDLVLIQPLLLSYANHAVLMLTSIFKHISIRKLKGGLYQNKVTLSLTFTRRLGY